MDCDLVIEKQAEYLLVVGRGTRTRESLAKLAREVAAASEDRKATRVLLDITGMAGSLSLLDDFEVVGRDMASLPLPPVSHAFPKIAVVDLPEHRERSEFFETVSRNRGFNLRIFSAEIDALEWLCR